jgi:hypothetical protein
MATRKNPASDVVAFFETTPIETATVVFQIVKGILARRRGISARPRLKKLAKAAAPESVA